MSSPQSPSETILPKIPIQMIVNFTQCNNSIAGMQEHMKMSVSKVGQNLNTCGSWMRVHGSSLYFPGFFYIRLKFSIINNFFNQNKKNKQSPLSLSVSFL